MDEPAVDLGGCLICGRNDGFVNVAEHHWSYCLTHRTMWWAGSNMFSSWKYETDEEQRAAFAEIESFAILR